VLRGQLRLLGSKWRGRYTGPGRHRDVKLLPAAPHDHGEGGAVYHRHTSCAILLSMRDWGRGLHLRACVDNKSGSVSPAVRTRCPSLRHKYVYSEFGFNLKVSDMQAAIGVEQLQKLPEFTKAVAATLTPLSRLSRRQPTSLCYRSRLRVPSPAGSLPHVSARRRRSHARRDRARARAARCRRMLFAGNMVRQPAFDAMRASGEGYRVAGRLANTDRIMNDAFWIGSTPA